MTRFISCPTILWTVFSPVLIYCVFFTIISKYASPDIASASFYNSQMLIDISPRWPNPQEQDKDKDKAVDEIAQLILDKWEKDGTTEMLAGRVLKNWERKGALEGIVKRYVENWEYGYDEDEGDYANEED